MPTLHRFFCVIFYFLDFLYRHTAWILFKKHGIPQKCGATEVWSSTLFVGRQEVQRRDYFNVEAQRSQSTQRKPKAMKEVDRGM